MRVTDRYRLRPHLEAWWLRPESALWDAIAAHHIAPWLSGQPGLLDVGIGNGLFSFLTLGGRLHPDQDWFRHVNTDGYWAGADMFDYDAGDAARGLVAEPAQTRVAVGVDHKPALLAQARRLGFVDHVIVADANAPLPAVPYTTVFSNILYWLRDPLAVLADLGAGLPPGGRCVVVFPNAGFLSACESYTSQDPLWRQINRGRASHILWHMDPDPFQEAVRRAGVFDVCEVRRYLAPRTLRIWDIGLRPLAVPLVRMANALGDDDRRSIKAEWCDTIATLAGPVLEHEADEGARSGGFTLAVLSRRP